MCMALDRTVSPRKNDEILRNGGDQRTEIDCVKCGRKTNLDRMAIFTFGNEEVMGNFSSCM